jgi:hypothetical protein
VKLSDKNTCEEVISCVSLHHRKLDCDDSEL